MLSCIPRSRSKQNLGDFVCTQYSLHRKDTGELICYVRTAQRRDELIQYYAEQGIKVVYEACGYYDQ